MIFARDKLEMCEIELRRGGVQPFVRRQMVDTIDSLLCGVKLVWTSKRSMSQTTGSGGLPLSRPDAIRVVHSH